MPGSKLVKSLHVLRIAAALLVLACASLPASAADVTVFAAASLSDALQAVGKSYRQHTGHTVVFSLAATSALARQIESTPGADVFISADTDWMDYLDKRGLIAPGTRHDLLANHLVLIAPASSKTEVKIVPHFDILGALAGGRLAVADPGSVPAGKYAKSALTSLGVWDEVADHLAQAENVRVALAYVARGEAPLGIVYTTDAVAEPRVRIVDTFPDGTHRPIVYPVALTKTAKPLGREFLAYLSGRQARAIFEKDGFIVLGGGR